MKTTHWKNCVAWAADGRASALGAKNPHALGSDAAFHWQLGREQRNDSRDTRNRMVAATQRAGELRLKRRREGDGDER